MIPRHEFPLWEGMVVVGALAFGALLLVSPLAFYVWLGSSRDSAEETQVSSYDPPWTFEETETVAWEGLRVQVPLGTVPLKRSYDELLIRIGKAEYRIAREGSEWQVWVDGHKAAGFGERNRVVLREEGFSVAREVLR
jgi:hypothetical protein